MLYSAQLLTVFVLVHFSFKILNVWYPFPQSIPGDSHHMWCRHMKDEGHVTYHPWHANTADKQHQTRNHAQKSWPTEETVCEQNQNTDATQVTQIELHKDNHYKYTSHCNCTGPPAHREGRREGIRGNDRKEAKANYWMEDPWFMLG